MGVGEGRYNFGLKEMTFSCWEIGEKRLIGKEVLRVLGFPTFSFSCPLGGSVSTDSDSQIAMSWRGRVSLLRGERTELV